MSLLTNSRVYLAGPVERDTACAPWRDEISARLAELGITIWSPLNKPEWFRDKLGADISPEFQIAVSYTNLTLTKMTQ